MRAVSLFLCVFLISNQMALPVYAEPEAQAAEATIAVPPAERADRLTLELQGVNIFDVFKMLAKKSGLNIVAGKNVQGQVSIYLQDVPVRDALTTILQSQGLASVEEAGIIKVITEDEFIKKYGRPYGDTRVTKIFHLNHASAEQIAGKLSENKSAFGKIMTETRTNTLIITELPNVMDEMEKMLLETDQPQVTEVFRLNYSKVDDLEPKLKTFMEGSGGKVEIDKRSNRVVVLDISSRIERARALIEAFDVRTPQVLIDAKIVEVQLSDAYRKGINWQEIISQVGNISSIRAVAPLTVSPPTGASSLATLTIGSGTDDLQAVLSLLERVGKTNLLSSPRLMAMNNEEAKLEVATKEPYVSQTVVQTTTSTNTADNVQFVDVGVTLKVQPTISRNNMVEMKIKPEVSSSSRTLELEGVSSGSDTTFIRTRIPIVTTQGIETTVQVKSGHTVIIGGLIQDSQSKISSRVPILGDIPIIGRAFESNSDDFAKTELVVFLTPHIIDPSETSPETQSEMTRLLDASGQLKPFDEVALVAAPMPDGILASLKQPYWEPKKRKGIKP